jgi:hypothetical protein
LVVIGLGEVFFGVPLIATMWSFLIALTTLAVGVLVVGSVLKPFPKMPLGNQKTRAVKKSIYAVSSVVIVLSATLITLRTTNVVREGSLVSWNSPERANLTVRGILTDIKLNYEVSYVVIYHIFPALISLRVTEVLWSNLTTTNEDWLNRTMIVCYDNPIVPKVALGQEVKVSGYFAPWIEDSFYSENLVIAPSISDCYLTSL